MPDISGEVCKPGCSNVAAVATISNCGSIRRTVLAAVAISDQLLGCTDLTDGEAYFMDQYAL